MVAPVFEVRPGRLTRSLVLVAVVMGIAAGAIACVVQLATGGGHEHVVAGPVASTHAGHVGLGAAEPGDTDDLDVDRDDRDDGPAATEASGHPGMSCVVEVDIQVVDEQFATVCDSVDAVPVMALTQGSDGPEPPIPRPS